MSPIPRARPPLVFPLVLVVLAGCSGAVRAVDPAAAPPSALHDLAEREVRVHLADGQVRPARGIRVEPDTTSWVDADTGALVAVPTASVVEVRQRDRAGWSRRVAGRAALAAGLGGAVLGGAVALGGGGVLAPSGASAGERAATAVAVGIGGGAISAVYGLVGGAVAGAVVAPQDRYVLAPDSTAQ